MISFAYTIGAVKLIRVELNFNGMENLSTTQKLLLIVLASYANSEGECWPSQLKLAKTLGINPATVNLGLKKLEAEKLIESRPRKTINGGTASKIYRMLFEPFMFRQVQEQRYNCFGQRIDDPRMADTSWASE